MLQLKKHGKYYYLYNNIFLLLLQLHSIYHVHNIYLYLLSLYYYSELFAYTFHHLYGLNCTGLRFFTVYGPHGRPDMAPFKFIERVFHGMVIQQYGDGNTSRDYTYIDDIVDGVVAAIDKPLGCEVSVYTILIT